jgi:hypothetical protein
MLQKMVTPLHANNGETETTESSYDFIAAFPWKSAHAATVIR